MGSGYLSYAHAGGATNAADDLRTGWYPEEGFITPAIVSGGSCAQRWNATVNGQVNVQPDGALLAQDFIAPSNASNLDLLDRDLGSSGQAGLPSAYFGTSVARNLLVRSSKEGTCT